MNPEFQNNINMLLSKKQGFLNKAIQELQKGNYDTSAFLFSLESAIEHDIQNLLAPFIEKKEQ